MDVGRFETAVGEASAPEELWKLFTDFFSGTEVERVVYHHLPPLGAPDADNIRVSAHGIPEDIVRNYVEGRRYRHNPALNHARHSTEPFYFDQLESLSRASEEERVFVEQAQAAGLDNGLGIQVFGPAGRNGYCGLGLAADVRRLAPERGRDFQFVCQIAHLRYCALVIPELGPRPHLSRRETEILTWVARGKSNPEISIILSISAHTVDAHLRRVYLKLGVFERISAALRGVGIGLIDCTD